jgi:hypothetical protein
MRFPGSTSAMPAAQLVCLGSGNKDLEDGLRWLESSFKDRARGWVGFNVPLSHRLTAAADILLMPSRFEPCGLNQLYAMRCGERGRVDTTARERAGGVIWRAVSRWRTDLAAMLPSTALWTGCHELGGTSYTRRRGRPWDAWLCGPAALRFGSVGEDLGEWQAVS